LECIAKGEELDLDVLRENVDIFGGIFRHSLSQSKHHHKEKKKTVDARCDKVTADMLRSIAAHIDDDPQSTEGNISGFVLSYTDIPRDGDEAFRSPSLTMTSNYVRQKVMKKMSLTSYYEHLKMLAKVLNEEATDLTGKDLEASVVHLLSAGPGTVRWEYQGVKGESDMRVKRLSHTKRNVTRDIFNSTLVNYPSDTSYPLVDCVLVINNLYWAFQTTWQNDHAFKLCTLRSCREKLRLSCEQTLNILFVNPKYTNAYVQRHRNKYLAKGEDPSKPIWDGTIKRRVLMEAKDVATMWENTRIFVAYPKSNDWHDAIRSAFLAKSP
jgi:hypothetical protein